MSFATSQLPNSLTPQLLNTTSQTIEKQHKESVLFSEVIILSSKILLSTHSSHQLTLLSLNTNLHPQQHSTTAVKMVKTIPFADIHVQSPGFGAMGISHGLGTNLTLEEAEPVLLKAIELGCTFWDTAVCSPSPFFSLLEP